MARVDCRSVIISKHGPIVGRYNKALSQVYMKIDSWQKELQICFASLLADRTTRLLKRYPMPRFEVSSRVHQSQPAKEFLESPFYKKSRINFLHGTKRQELCDSEKLLKLQRHAFRRDWMESSLVVGRLQQVEQLLAKRTRTMAEQMSLLQSRIVAEDKPNVQRVEDPVDDWERNKPLMGNITPEQALEDLTKFEFGMKKAHLDQENL